MKHLSIILAMFILFLALKPGLDVLVPSMGADACCCSTTSTKCPSNTKDSDMPSKKEGAEKMCNPFQVCHTCVLFCSSMQSNWMQFPPLECFSVFRTSNSIVYATFLAEAWHPPQCIDWLCA